MLGRGQKWYIMIHFMVIKPRHALFCQGLAGVLFVDPGYLILVAEVVDADQLFFRSFSYQGKESFFPGLTEKPPIGSQSEVLEVSFCYFTVS